MATAELKRVEASELPEAIRSLYPFQSHWLDVPAGKMHYLDEGQGTPVLMVHGNPTWSFFYRNLVIGLRDEFRCIVPDHIGCGLSDKPQDFTYRLQDHIDHLITLVESLKLEKFHLVVHDWGGAIGTAVAEHFADKVQCIQVLNTAAFLSKVIPLRINVCRLPGVGEWWIRGFNAFAGAATFMAVTKPLPPAVKQGYLYPYNNYRNRIATHRFVKDIPLSSQHPSYAALEKIEAELPKLADKPMQICWGGRDFCFNDHFYEGWVKRFPKAMTHYFKDAGHYVLEDEAEACLSNIRKFFTEKEASVSPPV